MTHQISSYQICISGAHNGLSAEESKLVAKAAGVAVAKGGHALLTGATIGLPNVAAEAYKKAGGHNSLGISPAASKVEHVIKYRLPTEAYDAILYSGLHYVGRDLLLINSADAVISLGGRMGTFHEFSIAFETDTPIGFLNGTGGVNEEIMHVLEAAGEERTKIVVFGDTPEDILSQLVTILDERNKRYKKIYA